MTHRPLIIATSFLLGIGGSLVFSAAFIRVSADAQVPDPFLNALKTAEPNLPPDIVDTLGELRHLESAGGGIESGRNIICHDASGNSFGGDSELASAGLKAAIPSLVALLESSRDPQVLIDTANALSMINSKAVPMMATPALEQLLAKESAEESSRVNRRITSAKRRGASVTATVATTLGCIMAKTQNPSLRGYELLGPAARESPTVTEIESQLNSVVSDLNRLTLSSDCLEIEQYDDYSSELSVAAPIGLSGEPALAPLRSHLEHENPMVRIAIAKALGVTTSPSENVTTALTALLRDRCDAVKNEAIISLGNLGPSAQPAADLITQAFDHSDPILRAHAITAIGDIGGQSQDTIDSLTERLADEDAVVRISAAIALLKQQSTQAMVVDSAVLNAATSELSLALQSNDFYSQLTTIKALNGVGPQAELFADTLVSILADQDNPWETRLNALLILSKMSDGVQSTIQPLIEPFLLSALTRTDPNRYFPSSNLTIRSREAALDRGDRGQLIAIQDKSIEERRQLLHFYESWPINKRHAFWLTGINANTFPAFSQSLQTILQASDNDIKSRYNAAFILGFTFGSSQPSQATVSVLTSTMNNPDEDFDIRWMSAHSLARLGENVNDFFSVHHLPNPLTIDCGAGPFGDGPLFFEPYYGWCESTDSGGDGSSGWARALERFLGK